MTDVVSRLANRLHLTTDGHKPYLEAVEGAIGADMERQNLDSRLGMRRFTRLTSGFGKKLQPHYHMIALYAAFHNFVPIYATPRCASAMAAGLSKTLWRMDDLVAMIDLAAPNANWPRVDKLRIPRHTPRLSNTPACQTKRAVLRTAA